MPWRKILSLRQQAELRNAWLRQRLEEVLPALMEREGFDMWIVIAREYNEDPVIMTFLPEPEMAARRRTILVFTRQPDGRVERLTVSRYEAGGMYESMWDPSTEDQYACLGRLVRERDPGVIGVNVSDAFAFGDGLSHSEYERLVAALGDSYASQLRSAERLCLGWLEWRILPEITAYPGIVEIGHAIIAEAFSTAVIHPGITTTDDVVWWMRQRMGGLGLQAWFQPSIEIQAPGQPYDQSDDRRKVIMPGDLLHCDMGFYYLGLATDQQQHAYVLRPGESEAPEGLRAALVTANRLQDIHNAGLVIGRTGNGVLKAVLEQAREEDIAATVYSHPLGYHGHAAGPTIGLWDQQEGVPGAGDYEVFDHTCYSVELNAVCPVPEWDGQMVRIALEEDVILTDGKVRWLDGRQTRFHLIG